MGSVGAAGPDPGSYPGAAVEDATGLTDDATNDVRTAERTDATIADELIDRAEDEGVVTVVARMSGFDDRRALSRLDREGVAQSLRSHAERTQRPVREFAASTEGVARVNSFWIANAVVLEVDTSAVSLEEIARLEGVTRLHENFELSVPAPVDGGAPTSVAGETAGGAGPAAVGPEAEEPSYGLEQINVPETWDEFDTQGEGVKVAVLDSGIALDHPDLELYTEDPDDPTYPGGWAYFDGNGDEVADSEPFDDNGHGTHVSGTVAAEPDPDHEEVPTYGVAPGADLLHGKVLEADGSGSFAQIAAGMEWAVEEGADVVSMSLGASDPNDYFPGLIEPVENVRDADVALIAAIGNVPLGGPDAPGYSGSPGNYYSTFAVGATDEGLNVPDFSLGEEIVTAEAWGDDAPDYWPDEYVEPTVSAPGDAVWSSDLVQGGQLGWSARSGTSMATPHVSGVAALMMAAGDPDTDEVLDVLEETAWKPDDWDGPDDERDNRYGAGIVDAYAATQAVSIDSAVEGQVADENGAPIEGATVRADGSETTTDENGEYRLLAEPGVYELTVEALGYDRDATEVVVPHETVVDHDVELQAALGVSVAEGQPETVGTGEAIEVAFDVANAETVTVDGTEAYYDGNATLVVAGEEREFGEPVAVDDADEQVVSVETEDDGIGQIALESTFEGAGETVSIDTGPTLVADASIGVIDDGDVRGEELVSILEDRLPEFYSIDLFTDVPAAIDAVDDYDGFVVQITNDDELAADLVDATDSPETGVVWLDTATWTTSWSADAIPERSEGVGDPEETGVQSPIDGPDDGAEEARYVIEQDHEIFDGVAEAGENVTIHDAIDPATDEPHAVRTWFDGYDGEVLAHTASEFGVDGAGIGVDEGRRSVLASSLGLSGWIDEDEWTDDALDILANAVEYASDSGSSPSVGPETVLGDVTRSGEVTLTDAIRLQQVLVGLDVEAFEPVGDVNRDGEVGLTDAIAVQQRLVGLRDGPDLEINGVEGPESASAGETVVVSADVENVGDVGALERLELRYGDGGTDLAEDGEVLDDAFVDVAIAGVEDPVDRAAETEVTFEVDADALGPGDHALGVFSADDGAETTLAVTEPSFEIASVEAPDGVDPGQAFTVEATVENAGTEADTQTIWYRLDDASVPLETAELSLEPNASETVSFNVSTDDLALESYDHGVYTGDDSWNSSVTVLDPLFEITGVDAPDEVAHGDTISVDATIENAGTETDEQTVSYGLEGYGAESPSVGPASSGPISVAVVGSLVEPPAEDVENITDALDEHLDGDYAVETVVDSELLESVGAYDVFVINDLGDDADSLEDFLAELDDDQGVVYLENGLGESNAISKLADLRDGLEAGFGTSAWDGENPVEFEITGTGDHPVLEGIGDVGDRVPMYEGDFDPERAWFEGYGGDVYAEVASSGSDPDGPSLGIDDAENEVLLSLGRYEQLGEFTDEADTLLANAVDHLAPDVEEVEEVTLELEPGQEATVGFVYGVSEADGGGDATHTVETDDDQVSVPTTIAAPDLVRVTDLETPADVIQSNEIAAEATLEHVGTEETTQDVELVFAGAVEATEEVTLEPGNETTVTLTHQVPREFEPGSYDVGVEVRFDGAVAGIDVLEGEEADFRLSDVDLPSSAGQGETVSVSAVVENVGDFEETRTVSYEFDPTDDGADPGDVDVAVVGSLADPPASEVENLTDDLDERLDDDYAVETVADSELLESVDVYDVFVLNDLGSGADPLADFLDELDDDQGVVYLENWLGDATAISRLADLRDGLEAGFGTSAWDGENPVEFEVTAYHPVLEGIGDEGARASVYDGVYDPERTWFTGYDGDVYAEVGAGGQETDGSAFGIDPDRNEVLLSLGRTEFVENFTAAADDLLADSVTYLADGLPFDERTIEYAGVTLDGGDSETVEFEFTVPDDTFTGVYDHGVSTGHDEATGEIEILHTEADIEVTGHVLDPAPEEDLYVGDTLETTATVVNDGDAAGEREIEFVLDDEVVDSETVALEPDEGTTVDLSTVVDEAGTVVASVNYAHPKSVSVEEPPEEATFQVAALEAPAEVDLGQTLAVDATIENVGDETDTRTVEFRFDDLESAALSEEVTLQGGESGLVTFEFDTADETVGSYDVGVFTGDDNETIAVDLVEPATAIAGTVTDADTGEGIENATVAGSGQTSFQTETDADGEYVAEVEPGYYVVAVEEANGYRTEATVSVGEGETVVQNFSLEAELGRIVGQVVDGAGEPIAGATVADGDGDAFAETTDENGTYAISDLERGLYALEVDADDHSPSGLTFVEINEPNETVEREFVLDRHTGDAEGEVVAADEPESGVENATVSVFAFDPAADGEADDAFATGGGGAFEAADLPFGEHGVVVDAEGYSPLETSVTIVAGETTDWGTFELAADENASTDEAAERGDDDATPALGFADAALGPVVPAISPVALPVRP